MRALVVVVALAGLVGTSARAQSFNPNWVNKPKGEDLMAAWPVKAMQREIEGSATLRCDVNVIGGLESCKVESETPAGEGFGAAALLLAPSFQMKPRIDRGKPVRGEVLIPIVFKFPDEAATGTRAPLPQGAVGATFMMVTKPLWRTAPSYADLVAVWPKGARDVADARVSMRCRVVPGGGVTACTTMTEEPGFKGFGAAARKLAPLFKLAIDPTVGAQKSVFANIPVVFVDPEVTPGARTVGRPLWIRGIDPTKAAEVFPAAAAAKGLTTGTGVADCAVAKDGGLTDCRVSREDPVGLGFGPAAVAIAGVMQMSPWTEDGRPVDGARIKLPIRLEKSADAPAAR